MTEQPVVSKRGRNAIPTDLYITQSQEKINEWEELLKLMKKVKEMIGESSSTSSKGKEKQEGKKKACYVEEEDPVVRESKLKKLFTSNFIDLLGKFNSLGSDVQEKLREILAMEQRIADSQKWKSLEKSEPKKGDVVTTPAKQEPPLKLMVSSEEVKQAHDSLYNKKTALQARLCKKRKQYHNKALHGQRYGCLEQLSQILFKHVDLQCRVKIMENLNLNGKKKMKKK